MTPIRAAFGTILLALRAQLVLVTGVVVSRVIITACEFEDVPHFGAQHDILIRPGAESPNVGAIDGAGRVVNRRYRDIHVCCRTRLSLDQTGQDTQRLTDESLGHFALEDAVCDALELFFPENMSGALTLPLRVGELSQARRDSKDENWISSVWRIEGAEYIRALDQARQ